MKIHSSFSMRNKPVSQFYHLQPPFSTLEVVQFTGFPNFGLFLTQSIGCTCGETSHMVPGNYNASFGGHETQFCSGSGESSRIFSFTSSQVLKMLTAAGGRSAGMPLLASFFSLSYGYMGTFLQFLAESPLFSQNCL